MFNKRFTYIITILLLTLLTVIGGACAYILYHPKGINIAIQLLNTRPDIQVHVGEIEGRLGDRFQLKNVELGLPGQWIQVEEMTVQWQPSGLLLGRLTFDTLQANQVHVLQHPSSAAPKKASGGGLPFPVQIATLDATSLFYESPSRAIYVDAIHLEGRPHQDHWTIDTLTVDSPFGFLEAQGNINWSEGGILHFNGKQIDPFADDPLWDVNLDLSGAYQWNNDGTQFSLDTLNGTWMNQPLQGQGHYQQGSGKSWTGDLQIGDNHLTTQGVWNDAPHFSWNIKAPTLETVLPNAHGHFYSNGTFDADGWNAAVDIQSLRYHRLDLQGIEGALSGTPDDHGLTLSGKVNDKKISLHYQGTGDFDGLTGPLKELAIGDYTLSSPTQLSLSKDHQVISPLCMVAPDSHVCFDFEHQPNQGWALNANSEHFPIAAFHPFLSDQITLAGVADMHVAYEREYGKSFSGDADISLTNGEFQWQNAEGKRYLFPLEALSLDLSHHKPIEVKLDVLLSPENKLTAQVALDLQHTLPWYWAPLSGRIQIQADDLESFSFIAPNVDLLKGKFEADIPLTGSLSAPRLEGGSANLDKVSIPFVNLGTTLLIDTLDLQGFGEKALSLSGEGHLGDGPLQLKGTISIENRQPVANIQINGEKLLVSNTEEYWIIASPNLQYQLAGGSARLDGKIRIDDANIIQRDTSHSISPSDDVHIISNIPKKTAPSQIGLVPIDSHLHLQIPNSIKFKGWGINGKLHGDVTIDTAPKKVSTANGQLTLLDGEYRAFGKTFQIKTGELIYSGGPLSNPILDIHAERNIIGPPNSLDAATANASTDVLVGLMLGGPLTKPVIQFYSEPSMSDADVVSYLFIGRPQGEISDSQADILFQAASQLIQLNGDEDLQSKLGLDELGLTTMNQPSENGGTLENTAFVIGKQLSDRLYVRYTYGLSNAINSINNELQIRLFLGRHLTVEGNAYSTGYGGDLLFNFER